MLHLHDPPHVESVNGAQTKGREASAFRICITLLSLRSFDQAAILKEVRKAPQVTVDERGKELSNPQEQISRTSSPAQLSQEGNRPRTHLSSAEKN